MNHLIPNLGAYALQITLLLGVALPLPRFLRLIHPKLRLRYWQGLLLLILIVPVLQPWQQSPMPVSTTLYAELEAMAGNGLSDFGFPFSPLLALLIVGIAGRLLWLVLGLFSLNRWRRFGIAPHSVPSELYTLHQQLAPRAKVLLSHHIETPLTFGWIRPTVLLPLSFLRLPLSQQRGIICHELLHVRRGDWANTLVEEVLRSLLWFHPAIWILLARINLSREQLVDREVIKLTQEPLSYLRALMHIAHSPGTSAPAAAFLHRSHLFHRIALLTQKGSRSEPYRPVKIAALLGALALTSMVGATAFPFLDSPTPEETISFRDAASRVSSRETPNQPLMVTEDVSKPRLLKRVQPVYPESARKDKLEGKVIVQVTIDKQGRVIDNQLLLSAREDLDHAALTAVRQWRFEPATQRGQPVAVFYNLTINYALQ